MQAEFVQWEKNVKAKCIFYVNVILLYKGVSFNLSLSNHSIYIETKRHPCDVDDVNVENTLSIYIAFPLDKFYLHSFQFSISRMISRCPHFFLVAD